MEIFKDVPIDPDTKILSQHEVMMNNIPALIQQWTWDCFIAESVIFSNADVAETSDGDLFKMVKTNYTIGDDRHTVSRSDSGYTFVNVNFKEFEDIIL